MKQIICFLFITFFSLKPFAQDEVYNLESGEGGFVPLAYIQVLSEEHMHLPNQHILSGESLQWNSFQDSFPPDNQKAYWFKLNLYNPENHSRWIISPGYWYEAQVYYRTNSQAWHTVDTSVFVPLSKRQYKSGLPFALITDAGESIEVLVKAKGFRFGREDDAQQIQIFKEELYAETQRQKARIQNAYLGFAIGIGGFHLVLLLWFREKTYFWLVISTAASPVFFQSLSGFGLTRLWPEMPVWNEYSPPVLAAVVAALYLQFGASFLNIEKQLPKFKNIINLLFFFMLLSVATVLYEDHNIVGIQSLITAIIAIMLLASSIYLAKKGIRYAWFFIIGNVMLLIAMFLWPMVELGFFPNSKVLPSVIDLAQFSSSLLGVCLALGMVERMQSMRQSMLQQALENERQRSEQERRTKALIEAQNIELESSNKALKELDILKDDFLARTSHELNTPLSGIIGLSQILLDQKIDLTDKERKEYLELIISRGEHLKDLVEELLEFVKTRKETITLYPEVFDVKTHINKLALTFETQAKEKGLKLIYSNIEHIEYRADPRRFRQILAILLDNAIKYTDRGEVEITSQITEENMLIHVRDTGVGIKKSQLEDIFEPFRQLRQNKKTREGAGLGLSICRHLVELHGGELAIESKYGKGSTFTIVLPLQSK
ncbi:MAG: sensor histidine kinase [Gammaproteobacteria bacterium]|nr:sensor histidine kinase [Gammaproteobacteria bacterium]